MSLIRLLTAGKSWVGMSDEPTRYQMTDPRSMPKFGSDKNPFERRATTAQAAVESVAEIASANTDAVEGEKVKEQGPCETQRVEKVCGLDNSGRNANALRPSGSQPESAPARPEPVKTATPVKTRQWLQSLKALFSRGPRSEFNRNLVRPKAAVQGELSLDNIKVMRNDLSDTDIEIVRARRAGAEATSANKERTQREDLTVNGSSDRALTETVST